MALPVVANKSPTNAAIAWQAFSIQYQGVGYNIPAGSTTMRWVFWRFNGGNPVLDAANDLPTNLTDDDLVLLGNREGIALRVQSANVVDGELIIDGSIFADALAVNIISSQHIVTAGLDAGVIKFGSMHGDRIQVGTLNADRIVVRGAVSAEDRALLDYTEDRAERAYNEAVEYLTAKGTDLVSNGTGFLKTNYNFSWADFNQADAPNGAVGSFLVKTTAQQVRRIDEFIPYDPTKSYRFSFQARQTVPGATNRFYGSVTPYDAFGNVISPANSHFWGGTTTKLARELKNGDTEIWLQDDATEWWGGPVRSAGTSAQNRVMIIWDWVDPAGKVWPAQTYSRNYILRDLWADGGISGKVITLRAPWAGGTHPAGRSVSNGSNPGSAGVYTPFASNIVVPETWTSYSGVLKAGTPVVNETPGVVNNFSWAAGLPRGTAQIDVGFLLNYPANPSNSIVGRHAVAAVSFSDASAASADAYDAYIRWAPLGITTIDGGKITADSITAAQVAANAISTSELAANAVTAVKISALAVIAEKIAASAVTTDKINALAVVAEKIAANAVTAEKIIANAVTSEKIMANAVIAVKIAANAVEADKIMANAVTAAKIAASAVEADKIAANAVTAAKIKAGELTSDHIVTTGLDAAVIKFGSMHGDRISVGTLKADRIDAATVTADFLKANGAFIGALQTVDLTATTLTGPTLRTSATGSRVVIENEMVGTTQYGQIEFYGATDVAFPAKIRGIQDENRQTLALYSGRQSADAGDIDSSIMIKGGTTANGRSIVHNSDLTQVNSHLFAHTLYLSGGSKQDWDLISKQRGIKIELGGLQVVNGFAEFGSGVSFRRSTGTKVYGVTAGQEIGRSCNAQGYYRVNHGIDKVPTSIQCTMLNANWTANVTDRTATYFEVEFRSKTNNALSGSQVQNMMWQCISTD